MKAYNYIKSKIVSTMLIIFVLVSGVGFLTYRQFSKVLKSVSEAAKPNKSIALTKGLLYNMTQAENSVKTFTLTNDSTYFENYKLYYGKVLNKLEIMQGLGQAERMEKRPFDSLKALTILKFQILDEFLSLQNEYRVEEALTKVTKKLDQVVVEEVESEKKKSYFSWKNRNQPEANVSFTMDEMNRDLQQIKKLETSKEEEQRELELELLFFDKRVTNNIQSLILDLEKTDKEMAAKKSNEIESAVKMTNIQILIFCIVISLLLVFISFTIVKYISNNNRYRKALKKANREAISLAKAKQHFVATVSHEIRTPMNIISGFTEQLSQSKLDERQSEQIGIIQKASGHLLKLINEVLDFTKLEHGKLTFEKIGFIPREVIKEIVAFVKPAAESNELLIEYNIKSNVPEILVGDAFRLKQILLNVIGNALKFTAKGKISIELELLTDNPKTKLRMRITDTGIGMKQDKADRVFNEFEQAENNTASTYGGTGLGLSITKKLVELQEGTIAIESEFDVGTSVIIEIPYATGEVKDIIQKEEFSSNLDLSRIKILIVDDESFNRKLLQAILEKYNAILTEAKDGLEAVERAEKYSYDLILMDARMPNMDGVTASRKIMKICKKKNIDIPIIALTAAVTEEDRKMYKNAGMIEFIAKPYKESELMEKIKLVLKLDMDTDNSDQEKETDKDVRIDFGELKKLSGDDHEFYADMLHTFINNTKEGILEIGSSVDTKNWGNAAEYAHKISSPCKHLSANKLYQSLKKIEALCREKENLESVAGIFKEAQTESEWVLAKVEKELEQ